MDPLLTLLALLAETILYANSSVNSSSAQIVLMHNSRRTPPSSRPKRLSANCPPLCIAKSVPLGRHPSKLRLTPQILIATVVIIAEAVMVIATSRRPAPQPKFCPNLKNRARSKPGAIPV